MFLNMDQLEKQLDNEEFQEIGSMVVFKVLEAQFQMFIKSWIYLDDEYVVMTRNYFLQYTQLEIPEFRDTLIQHMESVQKSIDERAQHKREYDSWVNERHIQTTEERVDTSKALYASLVDKESSGTESKEHDTSNRSGNDAHADDADIKPIYDEEPKDENAEQCHDTCPLPAKLTDNQITEHSYQSIESENICLKKTIAQFQKDFLRMEAHCVNLELKYQNQALKEGQHGQFSKVKSIEAKVKHDIDVIETINVELEHKMAKLLKENETLKKHYKELYDSTKTTRARNIKHTTSLIAKNNDFKAQLQEKGFAIAALKNELRKLTGNNVNTKFAKSSILGKPVLQPHRNQSVVRQPTAFKSERPRISKPQFASQVDVNNDLSKPVTTHYLPKERESAVVKPHHVIASSESRNSSKNMTRFSSNDMVHNHYLKEARKKTQESCLLLFDEIKEMSETSVANDTSGLVPQRQKASDYDNPDPAPELQNVSPSADTTSSSLTDNSTQPDTLPSTNTHHTLEPTTPTNVHAKENNNNQAEFTNPFCTLVQENAESSSRNIGTSNMHTFNQPQDSEYRWTKDHPLTQVRGNPSKPVQTRRKLATDPKMGMFALTGRMPTKIELTLEQSQQGVSNDVLVSIEGVEELKRNVWIKGEKKEALHTT
ncbi:hypothetical protein Tco_1134123 [Tanacetum coccineum]